MRLIFSYEVTNRMFDKVPIKLNGALLTRLTFEGAIDMVLSHLSLRIQFHVIASSMVKFDGEIIFLSDLRMESIRGSPVGFWRSNRTVHSAFKA